MIGKYSALNGHSNHLLQGLGNLVKERAETALEEEQRRTRSSSRDLLALPLSDSAVVIIYLHGSKISGQLMFAGEGRSVFSSVVAAGNLLCSYK